MKVGIIFSGNLRTFFMPLRENPNIRLCDVLLQNVVWATGGDVFLSTDTDNFFFEGTQYFHIEDKQSKQKTIDTFNWDQARFHNKVDFIESEEAKQKIIPAFNNLFRNQLKEMIVEKPYDVTKELKLEFLKQHINMGCVPEFMLQQHRKLNNAYKLLCDYESRNGFYYDIILRYRFDNLVIPQININEYDFNNYDIFVPMIKGPVYFDWSAIGTRTAMHHYCTIYDHLGFTLERGISYMYECTRCGICVAEHDNPDQGNLICPRCQRKDSIWIGNITLSSEHHVCETIKKYNLRCAIAKNQTHIYRYNNSNSSLSIDFLKNLNLGNFNLKSYTMHGGLTEYKIEGN